METVRFLADYRGVLTGEIFYQVGDVAEFDEQTAEALIRDGRAQDVSVAAPGPAAESTAGAIFAFEAPGEAEAELGDGPEAPAEPEKPKRGRPRKVK